MCAVPSSAPFPGRRRQPGEPSRSRVKLSPSAVRTAIRRALVRCGRPDGPVTLAFATDAVARAASARAGMTWPWFKAAVFWRGAEFRETDSPQAWPGALVRLVYDPRPDLSMWLHPSTTSEVTDGGTTEAGHG